MRLYLSSFRLGNKPEELIRLLAGKRKVAVILNAMDFLAPEQREENKTQEFERLKMLDLDFTELDLRNYFDASDSHELADTLGAYDAVWVRGGNSFLLRRAMKQSGADTIILDLLNKDAVVYAGYSAGIDMLVPSLHGIELVDDPYVVPDRYDKDVVWEGLGVLPYAIAPHYKSDHPESAAIDASIAYMIDNHIPFIALRDGQAIVIEGQSQTIVG